MIERGQRGKQDARVHNSLAEVGGENVNKIFPARVLEGKRGNQGVAQDHQEGSSADKRDKLSPARHDNAGNEATNGRGQRWDSEPGTGGGGGVEEDDLEEQRKIEKVLEERTCQSADQHGGKKGHGGTTRSKNNRLHSK